MALFGGKKKRGMRRVKPEKTIDRTLTADGERPSLLRPVLVVCLFTFLIVVVEQWRSVLRTGSTLVPVRLTGYVLLVALSVFVTAAYLFAFERRSFRKRVRLLNYGMLCLCFLIIGRILRVEQVAVPAFLTPLSVLAILLVVLYTQRVAVAGVLAVAFLISLDPQTGRYGEIGAFDLQLFIVNATGAIVGIFVARRIDTRTRLIKAGMLVGLGHVAGLVFAYLVFMAPSGSGWQALDWFTETGRNFARQMGPQTLGAGAGNLRFHLLWCLVSGVGAGFVLSGILPFVERIFRLATDMRLKELSDLNQPVLRRFLLEAPGSYHHSLVVGTLCEAAAARIGANPLLARVGSYFHDIGKINKPEYFTENEVIKGTKHATLSPAMSTLIIIAHVKDGVEIASDLNFPHEVISVIREHHGTSLVEYFYREALEEQKRENGEQVEDRLFRYPGPKPSTREAAILLLADAVEAATRTLGEPSPARIEEVVTELVRRRLNDGQLDESGLTLTELKRVEETFTRVLMGIFHTRIKYQKEP